jgi:hypothetical protein
VQDVQFQAKVVAETRRVTWSYKAIPQLSPPPSTSSLSSLSFSGQHQDSRLQLFPLSLIGNITSIVNNVSGSQTRRPGGSTINNILPLIIRYHTSTIRGCYCIRRDFACGSFLFNYWALEFRLSIVNRSTEILTGGGVGVIRFHGGYS